MHKHFYYLVFDVLRATEREKVLKCYFLVFTNCFCRKIWKPKKCSIRAWISVPERFPRWFTQGTGFFSIMKWFLIAFTNFLTLLVIYATSDDFFFHLEDSIGYMFKKPEIFITTVKIEYQGIFLFPGNSASNAK